MKKAVFALLVTLTLSTTSIQAVAYGGGGGGLGGTPSLTKEQLEKHWNGKPGPQSTPMAGIVAHWKADACGTLNGQQFDATKCKEKHEDKSE
ncbi:hypothetical protein QNZ73_003961 [Vibrio parahaemolyticus]|uniref:hypothetical protein n=1 Tax=Vibrio parahaemolyticus TaxID=670 RepID=UPI00077DF2BA|nr:hypothetical protein [Vibrio parahaemolyticus]ELB2078068.1 hypothetical protein [Vibrio parahaemolyticus]ELB2099553.1 hypothetical protein [Vibrio parahaemolyticus]ELB2209273.1 hypothetical protein [Vibrio parahaemolyticus]ELB2291072.1 hypothetical protein [Vibrio parahaemolyticus]KYJ93443.1 hypothetical protein AUK66_06690 [Vibrio parahaemolyticus]